MVVVTCCPKVPPMTRLLPALLLLSVACTGGKDGKKVEVSTDGDLTTRRFSATTDSRGIAAVEVPVAKGEEAFLVHATVASSGLYPSLERLESTGGGTALSWEDWYGDQSLTGAFYPEAADTIFNWPVREADGPLDSGTWIAEIAVTDDEGYYAGDEDLDVIVQTRADSGGLDVGSISVRLVYADGLADDAEVVSGTEGAVERWREVWAAYGLELVLETASSDIDPDLSDLYGADDDVFDQSAASTDDDIVVLVGERIGGRIDSYGIAGGIPGSLTESSRGAVVISWLANAGGDGTFSDEDIRLYGETLAHEVGHYTGLFHPVEDGWSAWDALDDTPDCGSTNACEGDLGENLMFPYPVCDWSTCPAQDQLSDGQVGVAQRYTGTL